ncbi:MAG: tetratricopeptide repeat protein [Leptolyngbya sp. Prado105]|nr:tetratricopeptide repeat protein [Leptolyngbya sp. Prado105]
MFSNSLIVSSVQGCGSPKPIRSVRFCPTNNGLVCDIPKGGETTQNALRLIEPYGRAVIATPESLSWTPIERVNHYLVQIEGKEVQWQQTVSQPSVQLPSNLPWKFGNAYQITIAAYTNQGKLVTARQTVVNRLTKAATQEISEQADRIQRFNSNNLDEAVALDLTNLYLSQGLLNEAIQALNLRIQSGSQNPIVYRVLGDVYLFAKAPRLAKSSYEKAIEIANRKGQVTEVAAARSGLAALQQLPSEYQRL